MRRGGLVDDDQSFQVYPAASVRVGGYAACQTLVAATSGLRRWLQKRRRRYWTQSYERLFRRPGQARADETVG